MSTTASCGEIPLRLGLFEVDLWNRAFERVGLGRGTTHWAAKRALAVWTLTWLALLLLSAFEGLALGGTPRESFLLDFAAMGQFWVCMPLLILAEPAIERHLKSAVESILGSRLLDQAATRELDTEIQRANRLASSGKFDLVIVLLTIPMSWIWAHDELRSGFPTWHATLQGDTKSLTWAGLWLLVVGIPAWNYVVMRWMWKVMLWYRLLWRFSRLDLRLVPGHPDGSAGLGFLGRLQEVFGILIFAVGVSIASTVAYKLVIESSSAHGAATAGPLIGFVVAAPTIFLAPLFFFTRKLYWCKHEHLRALDSFAAGQVREFDEKWLTVVAGPAETEPPPVGALADLHAVYAAADHMRIFPFDLSTVLHLTISAAGPIAPILLRYVPALEPVLRFLHE